MNVIKVILTLIILSFSIHVSSQNLNTIPKGKKGDVFTYNDKTGKWSKLNKLETELFKIHKEGNLKALQYKLINLNYDVEVTNSIDDKTIKAFEAEKLKQKNKKKNERKLKRLKRKKERKARKKLVRE